MVLLPIIIAGLKSHHSLNNILRFMLWTAVAAEEAEVGIETLFYRGEAALQRADVVRRNLAALLRDGADLGRIRPLLDELLDLVPLALEPSA